MSAPVIESACRNLERIREGHPLVHNITNHVVMNFTANVLLALGASPVMAHAMEEVEEMVGLADALVLNIGTLSKHWVDSMFVAARAARKKSIPIVLDPVGAGATKFRTETARRLVDDGVTVIRGNASELIAVSGRKSATKGVDSAHGTDEAGMAASELALQYKVVTAVTGAEDFITDGVRKATVANGHPLMGRITGTGCAASAITAAFCAVEEDSFAACAGALVFFGIAGQLAAAANPAVGAFQVLLLDAIDSMSEKHIRDLATVRAS